MSDQRARPSPALLLVWLVILGSIVVFQATDLTGDRGMANVVSFLLALLAVMTALTWLVVRSGLSSWARYGAVAAVVLGAVAFLVVFRIEGVSGSMVPILELRFAGAGESLPLPEGTSAARVDLASATVQDFPGFLGPGRDLRLEGPSLERDWESHPPELLWRRPIGAGWSGFAVVNGWAATLEQRDAGEVAALYDARTGEPAWATVLDDRRFAHPLGGVGPRSTPTIAGGKVYVMSVFGRLYALDGATGRPLWMHDLLQEYGISAGQEAAAVSYGRSASPLVDEGRVIVPVGGPPAHRVSIAAFDAAAGELLWEGGERQISMASPAIATLAGRRQILLVNENWVSGHDPETGRELWAFEWPGITSGDANVSQAVAAPPDAVFISKGYGSGAALHRLVPAGDRFETRQLWHQPRVLRTKLTNVAMHDGWVYGLSEGILECVELATGERAWKAGRYGHGQILMLGELILVLTEDGELVLVEASPEQHRELGRTQALNGHTWNNLALYGDLLLVRNAQEAAAWRLPLAQ